MSKFIVDVSYHNGTIDWGKAKAAGVEGAILRCGYGDNIIAQDDKQWKRNADECTRLGIPFGTYIYSYARTVEQAKSEAQHVLRLISKYKLSYPVFYDLEEPGTKNGSVERMKVFADIIEKAGYTCGLYCSKSWWDTGLNVLGDRYPLWIARYNKELGMTGVDMWQYGDDGKVDGISGKVDVNICYTDFTTSDTPKQEDKKQKSPTGSTLQLTYNVMLGKYGSGADRKKKLGDRYNEVQEFINHISKASVTTLVKEVKSGKYGNGDVRKTVLGVRYDEVQKAINGTGYYKKFSSNSLVDGLNSIGVDSSLKNRGKIAKANGISNYTGTATQNNKLLALAKQGKLKKV